MPYIAQVALRHKPELVIFGGDYSTKDGTGMNKFSYSSYNIVNTYYLK